MSLSKSASRGVAPVRTGAAQPATGSSGNFRGIMTMLAAMFLFVTNDTFVKLAGEHLATPQIIFIRGAIACVLVGILALSTGALSTWPQRGWRTIGLRTIGEIGGTVLFLTALFHMKIANVTAILQAMPLVMTVLSALILGEVVRWRRWMAVIAGFIGMLLVVQPGTSEFSVYALFAIASLAFASLRDLASRYLPAEMPSLFVAFVSMVAVTTVGGVWSLAEPWRPVSGEVLTYLACAAVLLSGAFYFITEAMRHGEVSVVAPFRYSIILTAIVAGYLVWGQLPDMMASAGIALIIVSGLYVFYRESRVHRPADKSAPGR
ncbi:DMT family transporter [Microbaculum marinum]|uniref:DMT family transporter n=1 Tax=Microbaculum marinum TaxID=1764581 RepID=A0AAW9RVL4_9HYPH